MAWLWGVALIAAVAWPGRLIGPLDGAPFDSAAKVLAFAFVLPVLWWLHPAFLQRAAVRAVVALLLGWKIATWMLLPQAGWCGEFLIKNPPAVGGWALTRSWDARTYWGTAPPVCSAIVARGYARPTHFPAWSINVPYGRDRDLSSGDFISLPVENPRPPNGEYALQVRGSVFAMRPGTLRFRTAPDIALGGDIDGMPVAAVNGQDAQLDLAAGPHQIDLMLNLTGRNWRFEPLWNGADLFSAAPTATEPMTYARAITQRGGRWVTPLLIAALFAGWAWAALNALTPGYLTLAMTALLTAAVAWLASRGVEATSARTAVLLLAGCLLIPVPPRLRNARGAWLLVGVPWLTLVAAMALRSVGRFTLFLFGDDTLTYQRFAHRIFMEGFWLEGGQPTFWNQPLYRWICGVLHLLFGDSSAGELIWDGFGLLVGAMFAYVIVNRFGGFRSGIAAAVAVLVTVSIGPIWYLIGRGLSEISALLWIYLAACCLVDADSASVGRPLLAGLFATLAFYTRMNHLPLLVALAALTLMDGIEAGSAFHLVRVWNRLPKRVVLVYELTLAAGLFAFAMRTWYYTGRVSLFAGTQFDFLRVALGSSVGSFWSVEAWRQTLASLLMIVTVQDPPRFDWRSLMVVGGFGASLLGLLHAPLVRRLPLGVAVFCVAAVAGGVVARGSAYPGRFSAHLIPAAVAVFMLLVVSLQKELGWRLIS